MRSVARGTLSNESDRQRRQRQHRSEADYISLLPIDILFHIFYFLPLESWLTMSTVSKRYKNLWTRIPFLVFDQDKIEDKIMGSHICPKHGEYHYGFLPHPDCAQVIRLKFVEVVDRILSLHSGSTLNRFNLSINYYELHSLSSSMVDKWVSFAMTRNIIEVTLTFDSFKNLNLKPYAMPCQPFSSNVLTTLTLDACHFKASSLGTFENLSVLNLINVTLLDNTVEHLLSRFPILSDLYMESCEFEEMFFVTKSIVKVKVLNLGNCVTRRWVFPIHITAPNLVRFQLCGEFLESCSISGANKLKDVYIYIPISSANALQGDLLCSLLKDLRHCESLFLNSWCLQVLATRQGGGSEPFYQLQNTKELHLEVSMIKQELPGICCLLRSCPNLQTLTFDSEYEPIIVEWEGFVPNVFEFQEENYWESQDKSFGCLEKSLKTITICDFTGQAMELQILKFLLQHSRLLETLDLGITDVLRLCEADIVKKFKRASPHACIVISDE